MLTKYRSVDNYSSFKSFEVPKPEDKKQFLVQDVKEVSNLS